MLEFGDQFYFYFFLFDLKSPKCIIYNESKNYEQYLFHVILKEKKKEKKY